INYILREYLNVFIIAYLNNMLIYINRILKKHIKYTKRKYVFYRIKVKFLKYLISQNRIVVNFNKIKDILS
ncbi:hypothetical protein K469DRAFT_596456, partial [Zopfia rhizophila CBS 207.26]